MLARPPRRFRGSYEEDPDLDEDPDIAEPAAKAQPRLCYPTMEAWLIDWLAEIYASST